MKLKICFTDSYFYDPDYEACEKMHSLFREQILGTDIKHEYVLMYDYNTYGAGKSKYLFIKVSYPKTETTTFINR